ncbi:MAG TPA: hypothetical protein PLF13_14030 [candidate division Zixibacteria bacterium]|nr:hypothetical protein [candidate division Zixibacteria bacterium]
MKKIIALATVAALLAVMFASPVTATDYDPHKPPWAYLMQPENDDSGDDVGWNEVDGIGPDDTQGTAFFIPFPWTTNGICIIGFIIEIPNFAGDDGDSSQRSAQSVTESNQ